MANKKNYALVPDDDFYAGLGRLSGDEKKTVAKKLLIFEGNPFHPSFRTKKMAGKYRNYESSVNMDIRILWRFREDGKSIVLLDVGHHDVLRKY